MTTTSPITDIHATEKKVAKHISDAKEKNDKKIVQTREDEEKKLLDLEEKLREKAKADCLEVRTSAGKKAEEDLKAGKSNTASIMKLAKEKIPEATKRAVEVFMEYAKN
jgi:vacuolar-type H+-ATPase subunit H